ncbi:MAG: hypothetical protein EOM53_04460 [Alphaproteobacteria bacterium]|nr:hypothetical protein [Alphaproteobacteria bacterium]
MNGSVKDNAIIGVLNQSNSEGPFIYGGTIFGSAKILGKAKTCYWNGAAQSSCTASVSGGTIQGTGTLLTSQMGSDPGVYILTSASISGGTIGGSTVVYNNAHITGGTITGGINWINGGTIQESAQISGNSEIRGTVGGTAIVKEPVYIPSSLVTGGSWREIINYSKSYSSSSAYPACITTLSSIPTAGTSIIDFSRVCTHSSSSSEGDTTYTTTNADETVTCINNTLNLVYNMPGKVIIPVGVKVGNGTFDSRNIFPDNSTARVCWNEASNTGISNCSFTYGVSATARTTSFDVICPHGSGCSYKETCDEGQVVCNRGKSPTNFTWTAPQVSGGTINGQNVILYTGTITGGTITGENVSLRGTTLSNGTLSGTDLTLTNSTISGGTISGSNINTNAFSFSNGTLSGNGIILANSTMTNGVISGTSVEVLAGTISGGEIKNFVKVNTTGTISGGIIQGVEASSRTESIPCAATFNNYYSCSSGYDCHCGCSGCSTCYNTILGGCACVMVSQSKSCSWPRTYNLIYGTTSVSGGTICPKYTASSSMINGCTIGRTWSTSSYTSGTLSSNSGRCTNLCELTCSTVSATNVKTSGSGCSAPSPQSGCSGI